MSIKTELKNKIWLYMLEHIDDDDKELVNKTVAAFDISRTTAYNYLRQMIDKELVFKDDKAACNYKLKETVSSHVYKTSSFLEEDRIFSEDIFPLIKDLPKNVREIHRYAFTEIMNNAIEHSNAEIIMVSVFENYLNTRVLIMDNGIGIFRKIQLFFEEKGEKISLEEAVDSLFPGKLTTAKSNHSGEGIFFSSRACDSFTIYSDNMIFSHDIFSEEKSGDIQLMDKGTCVLMELANNSTKQLKDVFNMFTDSERGFFKTSIPISHVFSNGYPVSRSEARRLAASISNFEEVVLDFKDVESVGQAFAHELFVVFQNANPAIKIATENLQDDVARMINRVKNTK